jgi:predicted Zn-dependent peptidase
MSGTRTASIGVWVGVGARDEPAELSGVSHFLEHLLFKGTESRSASVISQSVDRVGGDINAFTSKEYTAYFCQLPARFSGDGIAMLGDVLTAPAIRETDLESERQVILEEIAMDDDSPDDVVHRVFAKQIFGDHPLGRETAGERETVERISADDVRTFFENRYVAADTVVSVAGAVDVDEVIEQITEAFESMPAGASSNGHRSPFASDHVAESVAIDDDTEQVHIVVGGSSIDRFDDDRDALDVVNHILGGGLSSRLFDEIRERRGLAYTVYSTASAFADAGSWSVYAGTLPQHADEVRGLIESEVDRLVAHGITDDELDIAHGYLAGSYEMGLEDSGARMARLGGQMTLLGEIRSVEDQLGRWAGVTRQDAQRVIDRVYGSSSSITIRLGPSPTR